MQQKYEMKYNITYKRLNRRFCKKINWVYSIVCKFTWELMKNYASIFNSNKGEFDSSYSSLRDNEGVWNVGNGMQKKLSQRTLDKPYYSGYMSPRTSNENLCNDKTVPSYNHTSPYCMKKLVYYPSSSMQNVCCEDVTSASIKQYKNPNAFDTIFKEKRNLDYYPKTCYSGNDLNYASVNHSQPSFFERKSVKCSNMSNYTNCNTDIKLDDLRTCKSKEKSPSRKSVNEKENLIKKNHTRHVSTFACFERATTPTLNHKKDSSQKQSNYQRPYRTSIKQLFPDQQQKDHIDKKRTLPDFGKVKQPKSAKIEKSNNFLSDDAHENYIKKGYLSNSYQHTLEKLSLKQNIVSSKFYTNLSSDEEIDNYQATARFNFGQQKYSKSKNESKFLMNTNTSIENNLSPTSRTSRKKIELSQFIIGPCKGKGRYGKVYLAIDKETGWICALKQLSYSAVKQMLPQFINQVKTQTFLDHPYTNKIYGYFVDKENVYLIMEYMTDGTLYDLIKKNGPVTEKVAATKLHQVSQALSHMHSYHVIHRDLKPENIVLTFGVCKICDFGWAVKSSRKRTTSCGTLDYLSPEMLRGTQYSSSIDLWAMGVLLYEMLVGKPPFYNVSIKETAKRIKQCEFTLPEKLSSQSKSLIECFLRKNPGERREMDGILKHPFFQKVEE